VLTRLRDPFGDQKLLVNAVTLRRAEILRHHRGREPAELIVPGVGACQYQQHSGGRLCLRRVDILDARMRMRGKHVHAVAHAGQNDIVNIAPLTRQEASIFHAPHRLPNSEFDHLS
jgi:hypothetical protein